MSRARTHDLLTVAAIGMVVYLVKNVVHEGLGHGGVCLLVGGEPVGISSGWWDGNYDAVSEWGHRWARAGGTFANLLLGFAGLLVWPRARRASSTTTYVVWLTIVANLLSGGGYMMIDPIAKFGDWGGFLEGLEPELPVRLVVIAAGVAVSLFAVFWGRRTIHAFAPTPKMLTWPPYFTGGVVFVASALLNPYGTKFVFTVAAATFGGTAWLAWFLPFIVRDRPSADEPKVVGRSMPWIAAGVGAALVTVFVLGPSIRFSRNGADHGVSRSQASLQPRRAYDDVDASKTAWQARLDALDDALK